MVLLTMVAIDVGRDHRRHARRGPDRGREQFGIAAGNAAAPPFQRAWGAALVPIVLIGLLNLLARLVARLTRLRR
jgi:hypothetical protein